jgi:gliding motility-associated lipoprotein GldD
MQYKIIYLLIFFTLLNCKPVYTPKPRGFFRIDFPEKKYVEMDMGFPYKFHIPDYAKIKPDPENMDKENWINVSVPQNRAEIHISYYDLYKNYDSRKLLLSKLIEETRTLAYKHSIKANSINEQIYMNPGEKVYGTVYRIGGNAASPMQFFLTDSVTHFLRGALYIRATPNTDSLKPVIDFLENDVIRLIETTTWN